MRAESHYRLTARQRAALLALLVLPVLMARALTPVGFMPVIDGTGIHIDFCPGEAQPPGALGVQSPAHHHHHGGAHHGTPGSASHAPCLFALSASPAFAPAAPAVAPLANAVSALAVELPSRVSVPAIVRAQTPRGPPLLA